MLDKRTEARYRKLIEAARRASQFAYRPYSQYNVGAAVLTFDGKIYSGCNIENAGYSQTVHAEECAVSKAISEGALAAAEARGLDQFSFIKAVAVYAPKGSDPWPCCNCRQFLSEFGFEMDIIGFAGTDESTVLCMKLGELIPKPFPIKEVLASVRGQR